VRKTVIGKTNWPLSEFQGKTVLENAVAKACTAKNVHWVVVTSANEDILEHVKELHGYDKLIVLPRPADFERIHETLNRTFDMVFNTLAERSIYPQAIMSMSLEYPFITSDSLDDAVNTLTLFNGDSLLSVRPDNRMYYQHIGHGMVPILDQDKFTKLEREALYKGAGGIVISTLKNYRVNNRMVGGKVGHIVMEQQEAFGVFSEFDLQLIKSLQLRP
jgi:CMP-N-acetylneuraminic acid synthetase